MRGRLVLPGAIFLAGAAATLGAVWLARVSVGGAASEVLRAETALASRLLREPEGEAVVRLLLGERWRVTEEVDPLLDEAVESADGAEARAAVYDAESWFTTGTLHVRPGPALRVSTPLAVWLSTVLALLGLAATACWGVMHAWSARTMGALALGLGLGPVLLASGAARRDLERLGAERIELARRALSIAGIAGKVLARPGGLRELTGLDFVAWDAQGRIAATSLPEERAAALLVAPAAGVSRVEVGRVPCLVAAVGQARLVLVAYEHARDPAARMIGVLGVGALLSGLLASLAPLLGQPRRLRQELRAWSFLAPALVHLAIFTVGPLLFAAWLSLHRYSLIDVGQPFVGLENYARLLRDGRFWNAIRNTAVFTLHVPFSMAMALLLALLVRGRARGVGWARTAFFLPSITSLAAVAMVWQWMLHDEYGLVNWGLSLVGLGPVRWLSSPGTALLSIMIVSTWISVGYQMVLFQAGLSAIPEELYDAARLDGAGALARFLHVTLPGLRHTLFFVLVTSVIGSFQVFATVYVITEGGPLHATDVAVYHIYEEAWEYFRFGSASAMSFVLFAIIFAVTWFHFRFLEQRVQEPA